MGEIKLYFDFLPDEIKVILYRMLKSDAKGTIGGVYQDSYSKFEADLTLGRINPFDIFDHKIIDVDYILKDIMIYLDGVKPDSYRSYGKHLFYFEKALVQYNDISQAKERVKECLRGQVTLFFDSHTNKHKAEQRVDLHYYDRLIFLFVVSPDLIGKYIVTTIDADWTDGEILHFYIQKDFRNLWNLDLTQENRDTILRVTGYIKPIVPKVAFNLSVKPITDETDKDDIFEEWADVGDDGDEGDQDWGDATQEWGQNWDDIVKNDK